MTMMNERLDDRMMEGNPADFFAKGTLQEGGSSYDPFRKAGNAIETPPLPPGFTGGMPPNVTYSGYSYGGTDPSYNANAHGRAMGMNLAGEMLQERQLTPMDQAGEMLQKRMSLPMVPNEGIGLGSPTRLGLANIVSNPSDAMLQAELTNRLSNLSPMQSQMPPMRPAGEMLGERQLTPMDWNNWWMDQTALPMQAQADLTRTATMGTPVSVNPWEWQSSNKTGLGSFITTPEIENPWTFGFHRKDKRLYDPYFQQRWNTGYNPFLNYLAGTMFPPHQAYNLYNQFIR
jgi:hypothetical protein